MSNRNHIKRNVFHHILTSHFKWMYISFAGDLERPTLSLITTHAVVSPGENIQFRCTIPKSRCNAAAEFHLFINGSSVSSEKHASSSTFNLFNVGVSHQGIYSCNYSYQNSIMKSPWSNTVQITVGECFNLVTLPTLYSVNA